MSFNKGDNYDYNGLLNTGDFLGNKIYYEGEPIIGLNNKIHSYELLFRLEKNNFIGYENFLKNIINNGLSFSIFAKACNVGFKYSEDTGNRININTEISDLLTNGFEEFIFRLIEKFPKVRTENIIIEILEHGDFNIVNMKLFINNETNNFDIKFISELRKYGSKIVIEGVENKNILDFVTNNFSFDYLQGYNFKNKNIILPKMNNSDIII